MLRAFIKDSAVYTIPAFLSRGLSILLVPLYTRVLDPADYGALDLLTVFGVIVNLTVALEVSQGVARFYTEESDPDRKVAYASSAFWFTVGCYTAFGFLALMLAHSLSALIMGREGLETVFRIGVLHIWLNGIFHLIQNQFRWELRSKRYAVTSLLMTLVIAGTAVWLAYVLRWGLEGLLWGMVTGTAVGAGYGLWYLRQSFRLRFDWARLREMLQYSIPLVPSGIAVWVSSYVDRMMINHYLTLDEVGLYGIGFRLASVVGLVMVGFQGALTPLIYTYYREVDTPNQLARIFRIFLALSVMVSLGLTLFARDILVLVTTPEFYSGAVVVVYLVPAQLLAQMYIFAPGIAIAKKTYLFIWINIGGALLNAGLNWLFIPMWGIIGAGAATLLGYMAVFSVYMFFSQRLYPVPHEWHRIGVAVILAALLAVVVPALAQTDVLRWAINLLALAVMAGLIIVLGLVRFDEMSNALQVLRIRLRTSTVG